MMAVLTVYTIVIVIVIEVQEDDFLPVIDGGYNFVDIIIYTLIRAFYLPARLSFYL